MKRRALTKAEKAIERNLLKGAFANADKKTFNEVAQALSARKKDAILNIRVNSNDIAKIKRKAEKLGIKYQTFLSEIIHRIAHAS